MRINKKRRKGRQMGNAKIITAGNCMFCGKPIDGDSIFFCSECDKKHGIIPKREMRLTNNDAIEWLFLCMSKGIHFDDEDNEETKDLREGARKCMKEAFSIAISELDAIRKRRYIPIGWLEGLESVSKEHDIENISKSVENILKIWECWNDWKEEDPGVV